MVGEAGDGAEALRVLRDVEADVVVMDIRMPVLDGIDATRELVAAGSPVRVLALTTFDTDEDAFAALQAGAGGFLLKNAPPADLLAAVRAVACGNAMREHEVLLLVAQAGRTPRSASGCTSPRRP